MPNFEALKVEKQPTEQPSSLTPSGWIRIGDVEFKKDKQGRWRERSADATAPGVYINKTRIEQFNLNNTAKELPAPRQEEIIQGEMDLTPPPLPERAVKKSKAKTAVKEILESESAEAEKFSRRAGMTRVARAMEDVKEQSTEDVAEFEQALKESSRRAGMTQLGRALEDVKKQSTEDVAEFEQTAGSEQEKRKTKKVEEEEFGLGFLNKVPSEQNAKAYEAKARQRQAKVETLERDAYKQLTEELSLLWAKKDELGKLLAKKERENNPYLDKQFAVAAELLDKSMSEHDYDGTNAALDKTLARMSAIKMEQSEDVVALREVLQQIKSRLTTLETLIGKQDISGAIGEMLITGMKRKFKRYTRPVKETATAVEEPAKEEETAETKENVYSKLNELPNLAELRAQEERAESRAAKSKKRGTEIMKDVMREARELQTSIDVKQVEMRQEKEKAGMWKMLFNKETKSRIKSLENEITQLHEQLDGIVGDRDVGEVLGERELSPEITKANEPEQTFEKLTQEQIKELNIQKAQDFENLYAVLTEMDTIEKTGGAGNQLAEKIIKNIEEMRNFLAKDNVTKPIGENSLIFNSITRNYGLREKVRELLNAEITARAKEKQANAA